MTAIKKPDSQSQNLASEEGDEKRIERLFRKNSFFISAILPSSLLIELKPKISLKNLAETYDFLHKNQVFSRKNLKFIYDFIKNGGISPKSVFYTLKKAEKFTNLLTGRLLLLCGIFKEYWYERQNYHSRLAGS